MLFEKPTPGYLIPTTVTAGAVGNGLDLEPNYPSGRKLQTPLGAIALYDRATEIAAPLPGASAGDGRPASIELHVLVQACNDNGVCLPPDTIGLTVGY